MEDYQRSTRHCSWLGHMSAKGMKTLLSKGKLSDLKNVDVGLCEDCIFGKQKKVSFAKIGKRPKAERLELVHTDVWGPSSVPSFAGSLYYVTFIDDSTMMTGSKVKRLRFDNRGEYRNSRFRDFYANNGIKMETTVPMTPQQNGVAKRMNKTLNERARSMRILVGLPKFLWAEAINTATYLINHSAERSKLDAKSNKYAFVGYGGDEFGYRFWDYENRKIIKSRDIIFNENMMYKDRSTIESSNSNTETETKEFAEFEEISGNDVQISPEAVQEEPGTPELRRSSKILKPTQRYSPSLHYLLLIDNGEPECYDEAMQVEDSVKWESSMKDEMDSLMSNQTWELPELPPGKKLDVKITFLHGDLEEDIYMRQPEGFIEAGKKNLVCRLKKSLYGLKQAPRQWYKKFDSFMSSSGFTRCQEDMLVAASDMLVAGSDMQEIINLKQKNFKAAEYINKVLSRFNMQDAKPVSTPLGVHFRLSKEHSPKTEEERAHMVKVPYASAIGSLMEITRTQFISQQLLGILLVLINIDGAANREVKVLDSSEDSVAGCGRRFSASLTDFSRVGDGVTSNTMAFQAAVISLSQCVSYGRSLLFIPPGKWLTSSFNLTSHFTLYLHKDATILASQSEWAVIDPLPSYGRGMDAAGGRYISLIFGTNLTDVVIAGENGTVDGQGVTCNVVVKWLTILASVTSPNTDGINPGFVFASCCSFRLFMNTRIEDCYIVSGDDCIAVKSGCDQYSIKFGMPTKQLVIRRLTCISPFSAVIALGSKMSGGIEDVKDIYMRRMSMKTMKMVFWMEGNYGSHPDNDYNPNVIPVIRIINFRDVVAENMTMAARLEGILGHPFSGICISNVTIELAKRPKKIQWNCTEISGVSSDVTPKPCNLLMDQGPETACNFPEEDF
ncbi:putative polygalacturonase [Hibiscus syriacus]|uniref:Polygalacturonase n=1 Tax=Hibiscus syriacus TaxID=106335 RepID=A0A6A2YF03_HIBSY|nr:putative polygalacturonase [Hibiscus syriacus]